MARRLFIVEDTFSIKGRGLVSVPGILTEGEAVHGVDPRLSFVRPLSVF